MENDNYQIKLIGSALAGVIGGLLQGRYIWGDRTDNTPLSDHFSLLSRILEEIEKMNAIETDYVKAEK